MKSTIIFVFSLFLGACASYSPISVSKNSEYLKFGATYFEIFNAASSRSYFLSFTPGDVSLLGGREPEPFIFTGHTSFPLAFCETNSDMVCFSSESFNAAFAIPKDYSRSSWEHEGWQYEVAIRHEIEDFVRLQIVAKSKDDDNQRIFVWTSQRGLIAMKLADDEMYLLESGGCGFGAPVSCQ